MENVLSAVVQIDAHEVNQQLVRGCFHREFLGVGSAMICQLVQGVTPPLPEEIAGTGCSTSAAPEGSVSGERRWLEV